MKKRWIWLIVLAVLVVGVTVFRWVNSKDVVISHVRRNMEKLETYAANCIDQREDYVNYCGWNTRYDEYYGTVTFEVSYLGFGSQADMKGFYYAPDGQPSSRGCDLGCKTEGDGFCFLGEGDNYVYTEQIAENWFWFEQHW